MPIALILLAVLTASVFAYGTQSAWGSYSHGISIILWSRRLEWPAIAASLLLCGGLLILVIAGKKRAWWLAGLAPVLYLLMHRVGHGPTAGLSAIQDPPFITAAGARSLPANDLVVGLIVEGKPTAFPCTSLFRLPVVIRAGREKPMMLLWSPWANRALAFYVDRELRASDLQIVSAPDDALVIYNSRLGEFINSITGRTFSGAVPTNLHAPLDVVKTTWQNWQSLHPDTVIAAIPGADGDFSKPLLPKDQLPGSDGELKDQRQVCMVASTQPVAVPVDAIEDRPLNLTSGQTALLLVRVNGIPRAFNRELPADLIPRFAPIVDPKHKNAAWVDSDTNSEWSDAGVVVAGPKEMQGVAMQSIPLEDDLYWNVMKFWYPDLHLASDAELKAAVVVEPHPVEKPAGRKRRRAINPNDQVPKSQ